MNAALLATHGDELLDHPDADAGAVRLSLHHIARANWWFGGWWAVRHGLARLLADAAPGPLTVLDVGCGAGDLMARAVAWGRADGRELRPVGLERHRAAAALAREGGLPALLACAGALPLRERSVDLVVASQLLHHFSPSAIRDVCRAADRVARVGVVVADLRRSRLAAAGFWIGSRVLGFDQATRLDGITSVQRGFTAAGLHRLLADAGLTARVERTPGFRLVATWPAAGR